MGEEAAADVAGASEGATADGEVTWRKGVFLFALPLARFGFGFGGGNGAAFRNLYGFLTWLRVARFSASALSPALLPVSLPASLPDKTRRVKCF